MHIRFTGKYKSITNFDWQDVPKFVVLTGPNGTGKSQLLNLIYNTVINRIGTTERVEFFGSSFNTEEVTFLKGEWQLQNTGNVNLAYLQQTDQQKFQNFQQNQHRAHHDHDGNFKTNAFFRRFEQKFPGKNPQQITLEEFLKDYPELLVNQESELTQKISELFYNYRLSEIELKSDGKTESETKTILGEKPWTVLREILKASKLPFSINDPSQSGIRDGYQLKLTNDILNEQVNFSDLSSGEKVLIALVLFLYTSQEKNVFPKLLLMDEPDAHLHPSMCQQFINVIKDVLVDKYGVQVIMTTHSPSTVILAPDSAIFEMSRTEPRVKKSISKNHAVALLTAGLVYVGYGTKYFLVEDNDDVDFYSYIYGSMSEDNLIDASIPLVFISASTKDKSGGKSVVANWVNKLQDSGLIGIIQGLIDADSGNTASEGIFMLDRYSIENYLIDPILVFAVLLDKEKAPKIEGISLKIGEEYKLKNTSIELLQQIADKIFSMMEPELSNFITDIMPKDLEKSSVEFTNGIVLSYPNWILSKRGKTILNELYNKVFTSPIINATTLTKALKKVNIFPLELLKKFKELANSR